ncbi:MAG TPA: phosphoserine transaminase [Alphaproteobacteria bacterium]|nr:phosphoserine transaminase [Alphaproteobacteria bacterium]
MTTPHQTRPSKRPARPFFSSGPCAKRPGWSREALVNACLGRSHRSAAGKEKLVEVIDRSRAILGIPEDYRLAIVPGSDTGAVEMALWSLLGPRGVDALVWESFGANWATDLRQLDELDLRILEAPYGQLPDLRSVDFERDLVFVWNGTTSGVRVPDGNWIAPERAGLTICDATSAAFAMELPWDRLDVVTWSWQKALGGEGGHGMLALGPRALKRLTDHRPRWPIPKLFRMVEDGRVGEGLFRGETINTPSMLCVEDALDGLRWAESIGGHAGLIARCKENFAILDRWVGRTSWIEFLAIEASTRSPSSVCLRFADTTLERSAEARLVGAMVKRLEAETVAYDIGSYRSAPAGLRLWAGPTVAASDLTLVLPWLDWAYDECRRDLDRP